MEGWKNIPLQDACELFTDGDWVETKDQSPSGIRLIQTGNVGQGQFKDRKDKARHISSDTFDRLKCTEIFPGDCLVSRLPDPPGRSCIIPETEERMITAVDCTVIRFNSSVCLPEFFNYLTQSRSYLRDVDGYCTGATRRRISRKNLGKVQIPLPPLPEQERIVAILDEAFTAIATATANAEKNLANAKELFESHSNQLFARLVDFLEEKTLDEVCENLDRQRVPITKAKRIAGSIPYYGASGIVDHVEKALFDEDLLLVSEDGANLLARTYPIAFSISGPSWVNNHAHVLRFKSMQYQKYVEYYFNSISLEPFVSGMAQPKLNQGKLNSIPIPWPKDEQQASEVVESLSGIQSESVAISNIVKTRLDHLTNLKQSLLQKAFTGELTADKNAADRTLSEASV